jgi:hypothetical protein
LYCAKSHLAQASGFAPLLYLEKTPCGAFFYGAAGSGHGDPAASSGGVQPRQPGRIAIVIRWRGSDEQGWR